MTMTKEEWITYPEKDGFYWVADENTPGGDIAWLDVIAVRTPGVGGRWVSFMGAGEEHEKPLDKFACPGVWFMYIPEPTTGPWKTED